MDGNYLFFSLLFSCVGMAYFSYGRKQNAYFMVSGITLMVYPYVVSQTIFLVLVGIVLVLLPFILDRFMPL